jgi:hypothetical protein
LSLYPDEAIKRTTDVCKMSDVQVMNLIAELRSEIGQLRRENKLLKKDLRAALTAASETGVGK